MPSNYPTLKDISAEAGVSMALASVVLNGKKSRIKASPATREKILKAAEKFGYEPDRNARALRMSRSFLIGVLTSNISSSFVPNILVGIEKGIMHTNYSLLPVSFQEEKEIASCLEIFRRRKIDGLIIVFTEFREFPKESSCRRIYIKSGEKRGEGEQTASKKSDSLRLIFSVCGYSTILLLFFFAGLTFIFQMIYFVMIARNITGYHHGE